MTPRITRLLLFVVLIAGSFCCVASAQDADATAPKFSREQQREVTLLISRFRLAGKDLDKRVTIVRQAMTIGPPAVEAILSAIERELHPQLKRYRGLFSSQAALLVKKQARKTNLEEAAELRRTVLGLQHRPDFTKELIVANADPAMQRLAEIFLCNREQVIAGSKKLQTERQRIAALGALWEQCAIYLHRALPADADRPQQPPSFEKYIQGEEEIAVGMASPMSAQTRGVLATNAKLAARLDAEEARAILALNLTRTLLGLSPVAIDLKLCATARDHSSDMQRLEFFAHESPVSGKTTPWDRAKRMGTTANAENIYYGVHDGRVANQVWFHSPPHHKNMLGSYSRVGMGRSGSYFTEMFGR